MNMNSYLTSQKPTLLQTNASRVNLCAVTNESGTKFRYVLSLNKDTIFVSDEEHKISKEYDKSDVTLFMLTAVTSNNVTKYVLKVVLKAGNFHGYYSEAICELPTEYIHYDMQSLKILAGDNDIDIMYDCNDDNVLRAHAGPKNEP